MKLFAFTLLLSSATAYCNSAPYNCNRHKLYCTIVKLKPKINKDFAMQLSNAIYKSSNKYNVDPFRIIAIMRQESGINMNARNTQTVTKTHKECDEWERCITTTTTNKQTTDFGLFQFHIKTMQRHKLNINRVMTDMNFTVDFAVNMISRKIKMCSKIWPQTPWACYNTATNKLHQKYVKHVNRYYLGEAKTYGH